MIGIAVDESAAVITPHAEGVTFPILLDRDHLVCEALAISNIPTILWVDEENHIVVPNLETFGTDTFIEFTGVSSEPHKELVRAWVREGVVPLSRQEAAAAVIDLTEEEALAHLHWRIGANLVRAGESDRGHFDRAGELAPHDFTVRRSALPLVGKNPFGDDFFEMFEEFKDAGRPIHGLRGGVFGDEV